MPDRVSLINLIWIAITIACAALSLTASAVDDLDVYRIVGAVVPVVEGASFLALSLWTFYIKPDLLWSPLVWFFAACGVYFGLGPLIYYLGTPESIQFVNNYFPVSYQGLVRTNLLNSIGIGTTAIVFGVVRKFLPADQAASPDIGLGQIRAAKRVTYIFIIAGLPVQIFLSFPVAVGILNWTPPNAITQIGGFVDLSLIPIYWLWHVTHRAIYKVLFYTLLGFELLLAVATLSKFQIVLVVILSGLARLLVRPNFRDFAVAGVVMGVLYIAILQPFVTYGRIMLQKNNAQSTFELVSTIYGFGSEGMSALSVTQPSLQQWWVRIDYANAELFAMDSFDNGSPGNTINDIPYYFIPRIFYPEKPDLNPGVDFTSRVKGTILGANSTTPCTFGEGYWNLGWLGVIAVGTIMGFLFSLFTWLAQVTVSQRRFIYLPLILFGILLGGMPDGWFGLTYIGQTIIVLGTAGLLWLIEPLVADNWRSMPLRNVQKSA